VPTLPAIYDEPFADCSQIPTWLVSKVARQDVTVALSGDGGDELFAGYGYYKLGAQIWNLFGGIPRPLRRALKGMLGGIEPRAWDRLLGMLPATVPGFPRKKVTGEHLQMFLELADFQSFPQLFRRLLSQWDGIDLVRDVREAYSPFTAALPEGLSPLQTMQFLDFIQYLPDDILVKVDRASMAVSLEARCPILDYRVVEHAWRFKDAWKTTGGTVKAPLRNILATYLPAEMMDRPKQGFNIPLADWLRGPLRDWAEALLSAERLERDGFFRPEPVQAYWREHQAGLRNRHYPLWGVLMFNAWLDAQ
jgi:asparagine synthase (glutamine-hydrolysing)